MATISKKLNNILKSKFGLSENEISKLDEEKGWDIVNAVNKPKKETKVAICFTGFNDFEKSYLVNMAKENNMHHAHNVTQSCVFLCCGPDPGKLKLKAANDTGVMIITRDEFKTLIESGDLQNVVAKEVEKRNYSFE